MPIKIRCSCGNVLLAPESRLGQTGRCPACNRAITVQLPKIEEPEQTADTNSEESMVADSSNNSDVPQQKKAKAKRSLVNRLLSLCVYLIFLFCTTGIITLHTIDDPRQVKMPVPEWQGTWDEYKDFLFEVREQQRKYWNKASKATQNYIGSWTK